MFGKVIEALELGMISNFRKLLKGNSVDITECGSQFFYEDYFDGESGNYLFPRSLCKLIQPTQRA